MKSKSMICWYDMHSIDRNICVYTCYTFVKFFHVVSCPIIKDQTGQKMKREEKIMLTVYLKA